MSNAIKIKSLSKSFGSIAAVRNISFDVERGEVLGFLGPNGAGKSTTMKMITGFLEPSNGTAEVNGYDILNNPLSVKDSIGYLPEGAPAYGEMTVRNFLNFIADVRKLSGTIREKRLEEVIKYEIEHVKNCRALMLTKKYAQGCIPVEAQGHTRFAKWHSEIMKVVRGPVVSTLL